MSIPTIIKKQLGSTLHPIVWAYIRYSPIKVGKVKLWREFQWREKDYSSNTVDGIQMAGRAKDLVQGYIYYFGTWEPNLTAFIKNTLKDPERTFIDVGANVGYFSLLAAKLLDKGNVVAVEAFPSIFEKLKKNVELNNFDHVRLINCAASDEEKELLFYHSILNEGATTCKADGSTTEHAEFEKKPTKVKAKPLHELLTADEVKKTRLIKIDVEGAEYEVLKGLYPLFSSLPEDVEIIVEITPTVLSESQIKEILETFKENNFTPYIINNDYDPSYYINFKEADKPTKLVGIPTTQIDVIFSKNSSAYS